MVTTWRVRAAVFAAAVAISALGALSAHAATSSAALTPIQLGDGERPNVTVDQTGTAYIAWTGRGANSAQLFFCRLPRGATACAPLTQIAAPGDSLSIPLAFLGGTTIHVISYRYGLSGPSFAADMLFRSNDGGATFDAGTAVGAVAPNDYAFGPGDAAVSVIDAATSCGSCYQSLPIDGSPPAASPASLSSDHPYVGTLAMLDPNTPLAVFATGGGDGQFRRYSGSGDINTPGAWTAPVDIGPLDTPHLASGPSGLFLVAQDTLSGPGMQARKFDGTTFGPRVPIATGVRADHFVEDLSGRLHLVGGKFSSAPSGSALFYATSDNGTNWDTREIEFAQLPAAMRLDVAADHLGWAVGTFATGTPGVWATQIGPTAAQPTLAKFTQASVVSGTVLVQVPGSKGFVQLRGYDVIPVGSIVDATKGRVRITTVLPNGKLQSSDFFEGIFKVTQAKTGLTDLTLFGGSFKACGKAGGASAAKVKVVRHLWGNGAGLFRTKGKYASAAIRGTTWDTIDRCDGTLVKVTKGKILVTDFKRHKTVTLKAGQSYLAKA